MKVRLLLPAGGPAVAERWTHWAGSSQHPTGLLNRKKPEQVVAAGVPGRDSRPRLVTSGRKLAATSRPPALRVRDRVLATEPGLQARLVSHDRKQSPACLHRPAAPRRL